MNDRIFGVHLYSGRCFGMHWTVFRLVTGERQDGLKLSFKVMSRNYLHRRECQKEVQYVPNRHVECDLRGEGYKIEPSR